MGPEAEVSGAGEERPRSGSLVPPAKFVRLCILALLAEERCHGYGLLSKLESFGIAKGERASVYHILRKLEESGFLRSGWDLPEDSGPARRVYETTPAGRTFLVESAGDVQAHYRMLEKLMERCATVARRE